MYCFRIFHSKIATRKTQLSTNSFVCSLCSVLTTKCWASPWIQGQAWVGFHQCREFLLARSPISWQYVLLGISEKTFTRTDLCPVGFTVVMTFGICGCLSRSCIVIKTKDTSHYLFYHMYALSILLFEITNGTTHWWVTCTQTHNSILSPIVWECSFHQWTQCSMHHLQDWVELPAEVENSLSLTPRGNWQF
jgi:hypothetical protein